MKEQIFFRSEDCAQGNVKKNSEYRGEKMISDIIEALKIRVSIFGNTEVI